jgi:transposase
VIVDALGNPVAVSLTPGQAPDLSQAKPLLDEVEPEAFLADKATKNVIAFLQLSVSLST